MFTLSCFLRSCTPAQSRDVPVYLAHSTLSGGAANPAQTGRTPYRLLTISLMHELELVLLCGPSPSLMGAVAAAQTTILSGVALPHSFPSAGLTPASSVPKSAQAGTGAHSAMYHSLLSSALDFPRHLPNSFQFHAGILGFLFVFQQGSGKARARMVSSFLPNPTNLSAQAEEAANLALAASNGKKGRRSPSPSPRRSSPVEPPSPSQFAPSNPLFSSSLLSEASVLSRSHALLCFYEFVQPQLFPPVLSAAQTQFHASPPPSPRGEAAAAADPSLDERERDLPDEQTLLARATTLAAPSSAPVSSGASSDRPPAIQRATTTPSSSDLDEHKQSSPVDAAPVVTDAYMLTPVSAGGPNTPTICAHACPA